MAPEYGATETSLSERSQLVSGNFRAMLPVMVLSGEKLSRGTVVGVNTTTYKYSQLAPAAADGTEDARLVLSDDIDATAADASGQAYGAGEYVAADIIWPAGITAAQKSLALLQLQDRGVVIK